jgi:uncharacterized delta-60 repeat protein
MKNFITKISFLILLFFHISTIHATLGVSAAQNFAIGLQSDGSIVTAGSVTLNNLQQFSVARYNSFGIPDVTYGNNGYTVTPFGTGAQAAGIAILGNNEAIVAGFGEPVAGTSFAIGLYTTSGTLDTSFNSTGTNTTLIGAGCAANSIAIDSSGNYVTAGVGVISGTPNNALVRYLPAGTPDSSFGSSGIVITQIGDESIAYGLALQSDGQIVTSGFAIVSGNPSFAVARYNASNGSLDTSFNSGGMLPGTVTTAIGSDDIAYALAIDSSGNLVVAGVSNNAFALVRYLPNGSLDASFGSGGIVTTPITGTSSSVIYGIVIQPNGQIVVSGYADDYLALARYNTDGSLDTTGFNSSGSQPGVIKQPINQYSVGTCVTLNSSGQILVGGYSDQGALLVRFNTDGSLDTTFGTTSGITNFPNSTASIDVFGLTYANMAANAGIEYSQLNLTNSIVNSDINTNAGIQDTKLAPIQTPGTVLNSATTATNLGTPDSIVAYDSFGNFIANVITANLVGNVTGSASNNVLKSGDTMSGTLVIPAGSASNPSLQFNGNTNVGLSATSNKLTLSTNGVGALSIDSHGAVTIATPGSSEVGLTINGGGASITGAIASSANISFNGSGTKLNAVGSTQGPLVKIYTGTGNSGVSGTVTINYSGAGFANPPLICVTSTGGIVAALGVNSVTTTSASVLSGSTLNVPFSYIAIGV